MREYNGADVENPTIVQYTHELPTSLSRKRGDPPSKEGSYAPCLSYRLPLSGLLLDVVAVEHFLVTEVEASVADDRVCPYLP